MEIKDKVCKLAQHAPAEAVHNMLLESIVHLHSVNPHVAEDLVETFDGELNYNNFLTETEAQRILNDFLNEDGTHGPIWQARDFFAKAESIGIELDKAPDYNKWALYVTASHFVSNNLSAIAKWTGNDVTKYVECACDFAITQLRDRDKTKWIRWYFLNQL